ncbi:MAG: cell division protein FtsK [Endozoicomonadaceae bacterium]|nr:cell division protein FtsK [Endozoicomonadaceae bacterium]
MSAQLSNQKNEPVQHQTYSKSALKKDCQGLFFLMLSSYLTMALSTYTETDNAWLHANNQTIQNAGGPLGAWLADVLWSFLGLGSWCLIFSLHTVWILCFIDKFCFLNKTKQMASAVIKIPAIFILLTSVCGILTACELAYHDIAFLGGGLLGQFILSVLFPVVAVQGSILILSATSLISFMFWSQVAWSDIVQIIWKSVVWLIKKTDHLFRVAYLVFKKIKAYWMIVFLMIKVQYIKKNKRIKNDDSHINKPIASPVNQVQSSSTSLSWKGVVPVSTHLLDEKKIESVVMRSKLEQTQLGQLLENKLQDFGFIVKVVNVLPGPVVTRFEIEPAPGLKASKISSIAKDLARSLSVHAVRVVEIIPGKSVVGIEIPNPNRQIVSFRTLIESQAFVLSESPVSLALGQNIAGEVIIADLSDMPHLLVAGTTGSGKSVGVNAMILSILYKATPEQVRLIMIDPKMLELSVYAGIPHLLTPVITDMHQASNILTWCVSEMEKRYEIMTLLGVRNIQSYNDQVNQAHKKNIPLTVELKQGEFLKLESMPLIVVIIDEFADMIMVVGKKVETLITRIAQKARAAGIHLILATQRPSVDIITGLIKANVPARISFQVSSKIDSRTVLDQSGAEQLLGHGDMLYLAKGSSNLTRIHGAFVSDEEVHRVVTEWKKQAQPDSQNPDLSEGLQSTLEESSINSDDRNDSLYDEAVSFIIETKRVSILALQRRFKIGYGRANDLLDELEKKQVISANKGAGKARGILLK